MQVAINEQSHFVVVKEAVVLRHSLFLFRNRTIIIHSHKVGKPRETSSAVICQAREDLLDFL